MKKRDGLFKIAEIRGVAVHIHWSFPLGGVLISCIGHVDPKQWLYYCIAYTALVIVHEAGHVLAAAALRLKVFSIEISGIGGLCTFQRPHKIQQSVFVYSAGFLAQGLAFLFTLAYISAYGVPKSLMGWALYITFTFVNFFVFVLNLIPHRDIKSRFDSDGGVLWRLFLHVARGHPHPHPPLVVTPVNEAPVFPPQTSLLKMAGFRPPGFVHGIEILSDRTTPMEFVVSVLVDHLGLTKEQAIVTMLDIHNNGGMLIPLSSGQEAARVADAISTEAQAAGHAFVCRHTTEQPAA
jgi:ATP-dependent Clp protease adapter protein ClpS